MGIYYSSKSIIHPVSRDYFDKIRLAGGDIYEKNSINNFVIGLSRIIDPRLWICWPLRSTQNIGTSTTAFSLGGLFNSNGTLMNGPIWGVNGISFVSSSSQYLTCPFLTVSTPYIISVCVRPETTGGGSSCIMAVNGTLNADAMEINDQSSNVLNGGHRQIANSTYGGPAAQSFTTNSFMFVNQGWNGTTVRRQKNGTDNQTSSATAFGGFISPLQVNARGDNGGGSIGNNKTVAFVMATLTGGDASLYTSIYNIYKETLGQGLGLP